MSALGCMAFYDHVQLLTPKSSGFSAHVPRVAFDQCDEAIVEQLLMLGAKRPQPVAVWRPMLARRRRSSRMVPVSNAMPQTMQTCCSRETCDFSFARTAQRSRQGAVTAIGRKRACTRRP